MRGLPVNRLLLIVLLGIFATVGSAWAAPGDLVVRGARAPGRSTPGTQNITAGSLGSNVPVAAIFYATHANSESTSVAGGFKSIGYACFDGVAIQQHVVYGGSDDSVTPTNTSRGSLDNQAVAIFSNTVTQGNQPTDVANVTAFIAGGATLNWVASNQSHTPIVQAIFMHGIAVEECDVQWFKMLGSTDPPLVISDLGAEPSTVFTSAIGRFIVDVQSIDQWTSWGFATNDGVTLAEKSSGYGVTHNRNPSEVAAKLSSNFLGSVQGNGNAQMTVNSSVYNSSGFTLNISSGDFRTGLFMSMTFALGSKPVMKVIDTPTSPGITNYTGYGMDPQAVLFYMTPNTLEESAQVLSPGGVGWGFMDTSGYEGSLSIVTEDNVAGGSSLSRVEPNAIGVLDDDGTVLYRAASNGLISDGLSLNFTVVDPTPRKIITLAFPGDFIEPPVDPTPRRPLGGPIYMR